MENSKCAAFWHHVNIRNDNRIFPCCRFKAPLIQKFNGDVKEILFYKEYEDLRSKSLSGEFIQGCEKCYYEEKMGKKSLRQKFNDEYNINDISLKFLEIGFDNICNLTCDGCWEEFSSEWSKKKYPTSDKKLHYRSVEEITEVPDTIEKVLFLGGEPLMTNRHERFLDLIKDPSKIELIYNTNGTFLLDKILIQKLQNFKKIKFILSLDGYKELNEKVRSGSKWDVILQFVNQILNLGYILEINTVLHKNNILGVQELENYVKIGSPSLIIPTCLPISPSAVTSYKIPFSS